MHEKAVASVSLLAGRAAAHVRAYVQVVRGRRKGRVVSSRRSPVHSHGLKGLPHGHVIAERNVAAIGGLEGLWAPLRFLGFLELHAVHVREHVVHLHIRLFVSEGLRATTQRRRRPQAVKVIGQEGHHDVLGRGHLHGAERKTL